MWRDTERLTVYDILYVCHGGAAGFADVIAGKVKSAQPRAIHQNCMHPKRVSVWAA